MSIPDAQLAWNAADGILGSVDAQTDDITVTNFNQIVTILNGQMQLGFAEFDDVPLWQRAMLARASLLQRITEISNICITAAEQGYVLPENPFPMIDGLNRSRKLFDPLPDSFPGADIGAAIRELNAVVLAVDSGKIKLDRPASSGQIASFEVSVDGISSQSGDALADILGYQPDADAIKRKQAVDALGRLDFSKRKPYLLFVVDMVEDGHRTGETVICWQKMRDAGGYQIFRRDTFGMVDRPPISFDNVSIQGSTSELAKDPRFLKALSFYDWLGPDGYCAAMDETSPNTIYRYSVGAFQNKVPAGHSFFDVPSSALYLSDGQIQTFRGYVQDEADRFEVSTGSISPYPSLAKLVFGDPSYGWVIAGCNFFASSRRGDPGTKTRALGFIGSGIGSALDALQSQQLVVPNELSDIVSGIESGISSYGISQTILSILDGVGVTDFISGKDPISGFSPTTDSVAQSSNGLAKLLAAIDPETATVDPVALVASLSSPPSRKVHPIYATFSIGENGQASPRPRKPDPVTTIGKDPIDLTTYDGISRLLVAIRDFYDLYPGML